MDMQETSEEGEKATLIFKTIQKKVKVRFVITQYLYDVTSQTRGHAPHKPQSSPVTSKYTQITGKDKWTILDI